MKRLYLLLICLLLALCLTGVARAEMTEEPIPDLELKMKFTEKSFVLAPINAENGLPRIVDTTLLDAQIYCYCELESGLDGEPTWRMRQTGGPGLV